MADIAHQDSLYNTQNALSTENSTNAVNIQGRSRLGSPFISSQWLNLTHMYSSNFFALGRSTRNEPATC